MRIALWGNFGTHNLGNECTLAAAIVQIRRQLPEAQLCVICRGPADTASRHGLPAEPIGVETPPGEGAPAPRVLRIARRFGRECADWLRAIRRGAAFDALLIVGTGILTDIGEGTLGFPYELFKWSLAARLGRGRLLFVSVGVEAVTGVLARRFITGALRLADYRSYRDSRCVELLQAIGFRAAADRVFPDLAFALPPPPPARAPGPGRTVAVGLFNYRGRGTGSPEAAAAYARYLEQICTLIRSLLERGSRVRVIIGDVAYDAAVQEDVRARLEAEGVDLRAPAYADEPAASFEQLLAQLAATDIVIASRYHNVLLALLCGKPVLSLEYEGKNTELMREMGLGEFCQSLDELDVARLLGQLRTLEARHEALCGQVAVLAAAARDRLGVQLEAIARCIGRRD